MLPLKARTRSSVKQEALHLRALGEPKGKEAFSRMAMTTLTLSESSSSHQPYHEIRVITREVEHHLGV